MNTTLVDSHLLIKPSNRMSECIKFLEKTTDLPARLESIVSNKKLKNDNNKNINEFVTSSKDYDFITSINDKLKDENIFSQLLTLEMKTFSSNSSTEGYLRVEDLIWLKNHLAKERQHGKNIYLHELLKDCALYVPENGKIDRNPVLEERCKFLKNQQDNKKYKSMTRNVDSVRIREPQETIGYQLKQINKQLIAVFQFVVSVITGFVFGFLGVELMVGKLDFGFRLLLGIMCALTIALAELYFLAKQLVDQ